jgi:hypothetical protein
MKVLQKKVKSGEKTPFSTPKKAKPQARVTQVDKVFSTTLYATCF